LWINYLISLTFMFFGVYIIRENRNKKSPKMVINNQKLKNFRVSIIQGNNLQNCENWLRIGIMSKK